MTLGLEVTKYWRPHNDSRQDMGTGGEWICDVLERGTCVDATIVETRTSAAHPQERQATNHWWCTTHHTLECRLQDLLPHSCMVVERLNDHTVFTLTTHVHSEQRHQEQHCVGQQPDWCQHWWRHHDVGLGEGIWLSWSWLSGECAVLHGMR